MMLRWRGLLLILAGVALCDAVIFCFLYPQRTVPQINAESSELLLSNEEPITPIPLKIKLDARKVALGRRLFNDTILSADNTISCAHCHNLSAGGMDNLPRSIGIKGKEGLINAPTVFNSSFNFRQFWDGRTASLEEQIDFPINNPVEMGSTWGEIINKLGQDESYYREFSLIYPDAIQAATIKDAIATFERSLITPNSKFDRYLRGEKSVLDSDELAGYELFKNLGCISCHQGMNVGGNMFEKLGLFGDYFAHRGNLQKVDYGRFNFTHDEDNRYEFRVPSLRNVALTAPYFHDASAPTLEQAVAVMGKYQLGVDLSNENIAKIVKFLGTLTGIYQVDPDK